MISKLDLDLDRLDRRITKLVAERETLIREKAKQSGWKPCDDCFNGYCSMNCSSAPVYMMVLA